MRIGNSSPKSSLLPLLECFLVEGSQAGAALKPDTLAQRSHSLFQSACLWASFPSRVSWYWCERSLPLSGSWGWLKHPSASEGKLDAFRSFESAARFSKFSTAWFCCLWNTCFWCSIDIYIVWATIIWCEQPTHWKSPWWWEILRAEGEEGSRGWDG